MGKKRRVKAPSEESQMLSHREMSMYEMVPPTIWERDIVKFELIVPPSRRWPALWEMTTRSTNFGPSNNALESKRSKSPRKTVFPRR